MSWPERPPPRRKGTVPMVLIALLLLVIGLANWDSEAQQRMPTPVIVPGNYSVAIVLPPEVLDCRRRGFALFVPTTGASYRVASFNRLLMPLAIEFAPALDECIHVDGFEGGL